MGDDFEMFCVCVGVCVWGGGGGGGGDTPLQTMPKQ